MLDYRLLSLAIGLALLFESRASAERITDVSATATSELAGGVIDRTAIHAVDSSGLLGDTHVLFGEGMFWESVGIGAGFGVDRDPAITFAFPDVFALDSMRLWNFAEAASAVRRADILVSIDGIGFSSLGLQTFATSVNPAQDVNLNGAMARFVRLDILENGAGVQFPFAIGDPPLSGFAGLAEVQFFGSAVPEPYSISLLACGAIALIGFQRLRWCTKLRSRAILFRENRA